MKSLSVKSVKIIGVIPSYAFQRAKYLATELNRSMPLRFPPPDVIGLLELEWHEQLMEWRRLHGSEFYRLKRTVAIFVDGVFIGSDTDFLKMTSLGNVLVECIPLKNTSLMKEKFREDYLTRLKQTKLIYCFFDICVDDHFIGTLVFQLYSDLLPKTCENFTTLCLGSKGSFLSYKGSRIHRIVKNGWLQGGDIQYKTGGGGFSINCSSLEDECFGISHDRKGVLSMANDGKHTNGSQFFITLNPLTWMDTYYVAFGQLIEGVKVLDILENIDTFREQPLKKIEIKNCGKLDLEDDDNKYIQDMSDAIPRKRPKRIETLADQVMRLVMEALTEKLAVKEHIPDVTHVGDIPSLMNLDFFFHGLYSLPEDVVVETAKSLRSTRRELFRHLKPSATEVVEVITYDLLGAIFIKLIDLDDVREATGHPLYEKLIGKIDMEHDMTEKVYVKKFVDQLVVTAENIVKFISLKLNLLKSNSLKNRMFQEQLNDWVQSFTLQETFAGDEFRIADRVPYTAPGEKHPCEVNTERIQKKKVTLTNEEASPCAVKKIGKKRIGKEPCPVDICCDQRVHDDDDREFAINDFLNTCIYELKRPKGKKQERVPILDLIEMGRYHLRILRNQQDRRKSKARLCLEKRINRWMKDVAYVSEITWIRQTVFSNEDVCLSHIEEIMYGAMTVGLLEMYYLMEEYVKQPKKKVYRTRIIYPEEEEEEGEDHDGRDREKNSVTEKLLNGESPCSSESSEDGGKSWKERDGQGRKIMKEKDVISTKIRKPCACGDICCDCEFDPKDAYDVVSNKNIVTPPTPPPSLEASLESGADDDEMEGSTKGDESEPSSCHPSSIDAEEILSQVMGESKIDMKSFKWLQDYIVNNGCQFKSDFAGQVHNWLENGAFSYRGFLSKHSLVTKASLLSFSLSLASILKEENDLKSEVKDFVYDLWELYFKEMFKEAVLEHSIEPQQTEELLAPEIEEPRENAPVAEEMNYDVNEPCSKAKLMVKDDFDFNKFCCEHPTPNKTEAIGADVTAEEEHPTEKILVPVSEPLTASVNVKPELVLTGEDFDQERKTAEEIKEVRVTTGSQTGIRKNKSPIIVRELVVSSEEIRQSSPYAPPFWVKFLTEITKRAVGLIARLSRLPRRLYFTTESEMSFDDKMKAWIEFNNFTSPTTGGKDVRDFIAQHHVSIEDLDETARSFLRKKVVTEVIEKSSRSNSAVILAEELILNLLIRAMEKVEEGEEKKISNELWEDLVSLATVSASQGDVNDENEMEDTKITEYETESTDLL